MHPMTRRELLRLLGGAVVGYAALSLPGCRSRPSSVAVSLTPPVALPPTSSATATAPAPASPSEAPPRQAQPTATRTATPSPPYLAVARGSDPAEITRRAVAALGGMERFVRPGQTVIIKPNICATVGGPEYGATTHPAVVGALVALAWAAGAAKVQVMDAPFAGRPAEAYATSGITDAVKAAGGEMVVMSPLAYADTPIPEGRTLKSWQVYQPALKADVLIDAPVAKHHSLAGLTLGMKNLMGLLEPGGRGGFHGDLHQNIADLTTLLRPALTVVDGVRTLMAHGPTGGNLADVKQQDTVIASADIVAADAYATTLFGKRPADIGYVKIAADMGLGSADLKAMRIEEIRL